MNDAPKSLIRRLIDRVFPRMPDFYGLINEQCDMAVENMETFVACLASGGDEELAQQVRTLEHRADELKDRNIEILNESFSTPMDREDLYNAISGIDNIVNFAKTTIYELHMFEIPADEYMLELAQELQSGVESLRAGFALLDSKPADAEVHAKQAHKAERNMKKTYRRAVVNLLDSDRYRRNRAGKPGSDDQDIAMDYVGHVIKYREIYRHLSHAADRLARVSETLRDIIVKLV